MLRVVHVVSSLDSGCGVTEVVITLAKHIDRQRFSLAVVELGERGDRAPELEEIGVTVRTMGGASCLSLRAVPANLRALWRLVRFLRAHRPHLVHCHEFFAGTIGRSAAILAGTPMTVWGLHSADRWKKKTHVSIDRFLNRFTTALVTNSEAVKAFTVAQQVPPGRVHVVWNGVDLSPFRELGSRQAARTALGLPPDVPVLGTVGRLTEQKGHRWLIEAAELLKPRWPDLRVVIVGGEGHPSECVSESLRSLVRARHLESTVIFAGLRHDVPQLLPAFDVFVFPSLWEGFGLALVEAMAASLPIVAARVDAIPEVIDEQRTGLIVPVRDSVALAEAIAELLESPDLRVALGAAGRARAFELFSAQAFARRMQAVYEALAHDMSASAQLCCQPSDW